MTDLQEQHTMLPQPLYVGVKDDVGEAARDLHGYRMLNPQNLDTVSGALCLNGSITVSIRFISS